MFVTDFIDMFIKIGAIHFLVALIEKQRVTKVVCIPPLSTMDGVCTKFHGCPSNSCQDISIKAKTVKLMLAKQERSEESQ